LFQGDDGDFYSVKLVPAIFPAPIALVKKHIPDADTGWKAKLKALGVVKVCASYNGEGDSGCIEDVAAMDNEGAIVVIPASIKKELNELCYAKLEEKHGGWEINDGSDGHITFDLVKNKLTIDHNERIVETENSTDEEDI
jgi:hypothetical protein